MRWLSISLILLTFLACDNPNNGEDISTYSEGEPAVEETQDDNVDNLWIPKLFHVYIIDDTMDLCEETIINEYITDNGDDYNWVLTQARLMCESHNQEFPDEPRRTIGGGVN